MAAEAEKDKKPVITEEGGRTIDVVEKDAINMSRKDGVIADVEEGHADVEEGHVIETMNMVQKESIMLSSSPSDGIAVGIPLV